jgi:Xaa-Pro aminopeptidase
MPSPFRPFPPEEFAARRAAVLAQIEPNGVTLLSGAGPVRGFELFRQTNEFHYLCGVEIPQAYLLLDGRTGLTTLFLPHRNPHDTSEGEACGVEDAAAVMAETGVDAVAGLEALAAALDGATVVYALLRPAEGREACQDTLRHAAKLIAADPWDAAPSREERFALKIRELLPSAEIRDVAPILDDLRLIKSPREVERMKWSGELCGRALIEAIRLTRPGLSEYHLAGIADYVYRMNGVREAGYRPIIANGPNIWYAHYWSLVGPLVEGDLVIFDFAPDVGNYTSDIGRMWPVNGRYSPVQRELYGFMVRYHQALLPRIRAGALPREILRDAAEEMRPIVESTRWSKPIYREAAERALNFSGHLSHPVGMAVHDVGSYFERPLEAGMVFAVDPQLWIPQERLYVRVEDTVAVTETGCDVLTAIAPLELEDMEALVGSAQ